MKKASGIIEFGLLLAFVAIVTMGVMTLYNNKKSDIAGLSKTHANPKYTETAGALSKMVPPDPPIGSSGVTAP